MFPNLASLSSIRHSWGIWIYSTQIVWHRIIALHRCARRYRIVTPHRVHRTTSSCPSLYRIVAPHRCAYRHTASLYRIVVLHRHTASSCSSFYHIVVPHRRTHRYRIIVLIIVPIVVPHHRTLLTLYVCILFLPSTSILRSWILLLPSIAPTYNGISILYLDSICCRN